MPPAETVSREAGPLAAPRAVLGRVCELLQKHEDAAEHDGAGRWTISELQAGLREMDWALQDLQDHIDRFPDDGDRDEWLAFQSDAEAKLGEVRQVLAKDIPGYMSESETEDESVGPPQPPRSNRPNRPNWSQLAPPPDESLNVSRTSVGLDESRAGDSTCCIICACYIFYLLRGCCRREGRQGKYQQVSLDEP